MSLVTTTTWCRSPWWFPTTAARRLHPTRRDARHRGDATRAPPQRDVDGVPERPEWLPAARTDRILDQRRVRARSGLGRPENARRRSLAPATRLQLQAAAAAVVATHALHVHRAHPPTDVGGVPRQAPAVPALRRALPVAAAPGRGSSVPPTRAATVPLTTTTATLAQRPPVAECAARMGGAPPVLGWVLRA